MRGGVPTARATPSPVRAEPVEAFPPSGRPFDKLRANGVKSSVPWQVNGVEKNTPWQA